MNKFMRVDNKGKIGTIRFETFDKRIKIEFMVGKYKVFYRIPDSETYVLIFENRYIRFPSVMDTFDYGYNVDKKTFTMTVNENTIIVGKVLENTNEIITKVDITSAHRIFGEVKKKCIRAYRDAEGRIKNGMIMNFNMEPLGDFTVGPIFDL